MKFGKILLLLALISVAMSYQEEQQNNDQRRGDMLAKPSLKEDWLKKKGDWSNKKEDWNKNGPIELEKDGRQGPPMRGGKDQGPPRRGGRGGRRGPPRRGGRGGRRGPPRRGGRGGRRGPPRRGGKHHGRFHRKGANPWWKKSNQKGSMSDKFQEKSKFMIQKFKSFFKQCMNSESATADIQQLRICKKKTLSLKKKLWWKFHAANWRENLLRWHKRKSSNPSAINWAAIKSKSPQTSEQKNYLSEYKKLKQSNLQTPTPANLSAQTMLKQLLTKLKHQKHLITGYKQYKSQKDLWHKDKIGKCLTLRKKDFIKNLNQLYSTPEQDQEAERKSQKENIIKACKEIDPILPFANGGCLEKLSEQYSKLIYLFKSFLKERSEENIKKMGEGLISGYENLNNCLNPDLEKKAGDCKEYFRKELKVDDVRLENMKLGDGIGETIAMGWEWNKLGKAMNKVMNEDFWLNAPEDCGVSQNIVKGNVFKISEDMFKHEIETIG